MALTVAQILNTYSSSLKLIAGSDAIQNEVIEVGILDYELMPEVKSRFYRDNFHSKQLVASTFLYAREDNQKINEAIRYLSEKGCAGLIIKNVFQLQIPNLALRLAEARNFPILVTTDENFFLDELIVKVRDLYIQNKNTDWYKQKIKEILVEINTNKLLEKVNECFPYLFDEFICLRFLPTEVMNSARRSLLSDNWIKSKFNKTENSLIFLSDQILVALSQNDLGDRDLSDVVDELCGLFEEVKPLCGVSSLKRKKEDMALAIKESRWALALLEIPYSYPYSQLIKKRRLCYFEDLNDLCALISALQVDNGLSKYAQDLLKNIIYYDQQHQSSLMLTLITWQASLGDVSLTAQILNQNPNTIRYRLKKICELSGLASQTKTSEYSLMLACRIRIAQLIIQNASKDL